MHPSATGYISKLRRLAEHLFEAVSDEFSELPCVTVRFDRVGDLAEEDIEQEHLVAVTLLTAQLLHRAATHPEETRPSHVLTLATIIDQVVPALATHQAVGSVAANSLLDLGSAISRAAFGLMTLADPDAPNFADA